MRIIYRALTLVVVGLAAVQVAALAWFMGGAIAWTDAGRTLDRDLMWDGPAPFVEVHGLDVYWFVGSVVMPVAAVAVAIAAIVWRNELAILAALVLVGLAVGQALILKGAIEGLGAPALQGAIVVVIAAIAAIAPKGAAWATANREKVRATYAHTPLAA
ncbi:hypothetical protein [Demequina phytophila]|uniref:hypothetical protein n=1 Tax=Demequina phytophila TaxID=1638981 RepID=UPI00078663E7|nr:hypothetical protein [Demequina phytophila]